MPKDVKLPYFPLYPNDLTSDGLVEAMTTEEFGAYLLLLCKAWHERPSASIPNDDAILARWTRLSPDRWSECKKRVLSCFFLRPDGRLYQKRLEHEYRKLTTRLREASKAGKLGAERRWMNQPDLLGSDGVAITTPLRRQCNSQSEPNSNSGLNNPAGKKPFAEAFKTAFDTAFPQPYQWSQADFIQLSKWQKDYPNVTPETFVNVAKGQWARGDYRSSSSLTIKGLCTRWAQLAASVAPSKAIKATPTETPEQRRARRQSTEAEIS